MNSSDPPEAKPISCSLALPLEGLPPFYPLLAQGFYVPVAAGCSIQELLCCQLGWDIGFVEQRIQTIFMDGRLVDDINRAVTHDGASIALSGAMPGLLGAMVRKGSYYSAMRSQITYQSKVDNDQSSQGRVKVKLFNVIAREKGPALFNRGVLIKGKDFKSAITKFSEGFWARCEAITVDGKPMDSSQLLSFAMEGKEIFFQIHTSIS